MYLYIVIEVHLKIIINSIFPMIPMTELLNLMYNMIFNYILINSLTNTVLLFVCFLYIKKINIKNPALH